MSLVGNLEDLGFGDILQIISLSRKSGVFLVHEGERKAKILFRSGQVLAAFTNFERQDLCARLLASGDADEKIASTAIRRFRQQEGKHAISDCLIEAGARRQVVEREVRAEIGRAVIAIFGWRDGEFSFELKDIDEDLHRVRANPYRLVLEDGINPQFLAMEGTRLTDEARRDQGQSGIPAVISAPTAESAAEAGPDQPPVGPEMVEAVAPENSPGTTRAESPEAEKIPLQDPAHPPVLLVDDDVRFLEVVKTALIEKGYRVECFEDGGAAHDWLEADGAGRLPLCIVSDLIMPRADGEGILGGLELLERVRARHRTVPFVLFSDHPHDEAERRARLLDVDFVLAKPRSGEIAGGEGSRGLDGFLAAMDPILCSFLRRREEDDRPAAPSRDGGGPAPEDETILDLRRALLPDLPDLDDTGESQWREEGRPEEAAPGLSILRSMLCELSSPIAGGQISLLILRFAAEVMNRAVIFLAGKDEVTGLGQFGISAQPGLPDRSVRSIRIPLGAPSVFHDVVAKRSVLRGPLEENLWNQRLVDLLGGVRPLEAFVAPVVAGDGVVAVLYGDNLPEQRAIGNTESLEIFLTQAGVAFEKAILERRILELNTGQ
ncbi:MAG: response regulator [Deltaproteobacteria bacterium]|nr:response regulator [Deltaproteobacteria bacterium]